MLNNLLVVTLLVSDPNRDVNPGSLPVNGLFFWLLDTAGSLKSRIEVGEKKIRRGRFECHL